MNAFFLVLAIVVETLLLVRAVQSFGLLPSPTLILIGILMEQLTLYLVNIGALENQFFWSYSHAGVSFQFYRTQYSYASLFLFFYLAHLRLANTSGGRRFQTRISISGTTLRSMNVPVATITLAVEILFCFLLNWSIAWANNAYLEMTDGNAVISIPQLGVLFNVFISLGILSAILSGLNFGRNERRWGWVFAALMAFPMLYETGAHSRVAGAFPLVFGLAMYAVSQKRSLVALSAAIAASLLLVASGIIGRWSGANGLSTVSVSFVALLGDIPAVVNGLMTSIFEGSTVAAESMSISAEFDTTYKVLSLSPTPSFIDGFSTLRPFSEYRLSPFAPMSGLVEILDFGAGYLAVFLGIMLVAVRMTFSLARKSAPTFIIANAFLFVGFYTLNAYPVRTGIRWYWIAIGLALASYVAEFFQTSGPRSTDSLVNRLRLTTFRRAQLRASQAPQTQSRAPNE